MKYNKIIDFIINKMGLIQSKQAHEGIIRLDVMNLDTQYESYFLNIDKWVTIRERTGDIVLKIILNQKGPDRQPHLWYSIQIPQYYSLNSKKVGDILFVNLTQIEYDPSFLDSMDKQIKTVHIEHENLSSIKLLLSV